MKAEQLRETIEEFNNIVNTIKNGEVSIEEMRKGLETSKEEVSKAVKKLENILLGNEVEGIDSLQKYSIIEQVREELENYSKKEHKKEIKTLLEMVELMDKEIDEELFLPFIIDILGIIGKSTRSVDKDIEKTTRKTIKKFLKNRKD